MRVINVAAAQMGPIQKADSREAVAKRMIALMDEAKAASADLIIYPELALTTFFPRWYMEDQAEVDGWFERVQSGRHRVRLCRQRPLPQLVAPPVQRAIRRRRRSCPSRRDPDRD